jgi:hypothetical protein
LLDQNTPFEVDGHSAVAGTIAGQSGDALATWIAGDTLVTISAAMPVPQLIAVARTVHEVESTEWDGMTLEAIHNGVDDNGDTSNYQETLASPVSFGADSGSAPWTVQVSIATFGGRRQINWHWGRGGGLGTAVRDTPQIKTVVDHLRTFVLADLPRPVAPTAELRVLRDGLDPVVVPFNDIDPGLDRTFAAFAFGDAVPYTAQIVGPDGTVLASWPSP